MLGGSHGMTQLVGEDEQRGLLRDPLPDLAGEKINRQRLTQPAVEVELAHEYVMNAGERRPN